MHGHQKADGDKKLIQYSFELGTMKCKSETTINILYDKQVGIVGVHEENRTQTHHAPNATIRPLHRCLGGTHIHFGYYERMVRSAFAKM